MRWVSVVAGVMFLTVAAFAGEVDFTGRSDPDSYDYSLRTENEFANDLFKAELSSEITRRIENKTETMNLFAVDSRFHRMFRKDIEESIYVDAEFYSEEIEGYRHYIAGTGYRRNIIDCLAAEAGVLQKFVDNNAPENLLNSGLEFKKEFGKFEVRNALNYLYNMDREKNDIWVNDTSLSTPITDKLSLVTGFIYEKGIVEQCRKEARIGIRFSY